MNKNNLFIIKHSTNISYIETLLNDNKIQYEKYYLNSSNVTLPTNQILNDYFCIWNHFIKFNNSTNHYWIVLSDKIECIDLDNLSKLTDWANTHTNLFDLINLSCDINFLESLDPTNILKINSDLTLYKNNFNLSIGGYIVSNELLKKINIFNKNKDNTIPNLLFNLKSNKLLNDYNVNPNIIKDNELKNNIIVKIRNYLIKFKNNQKLILISVILLLLLLNINTQNNFIIYLILIYFFIFLI